MNRRGFMGSILALAAAPAIVRADSLMRIVPRGMLLLTDYERAEYFAAVGQASIDECVMVRVPVLLREARAVWVGAGDERNIFEPAQFGYREARINRALLDDPSPAARQMVRDLLRA